MPDYGIAGLIALTLAVLALPFLIPALRKLKFGQYVREDGPRSHLGKAGTPTMGGCVFLLTIPVAMLLSGPVTGEGWAALYLIIAMGILGFADDYLIIRRHNAKGLSARQKMIGQIIAACLFAAVLWRMRGGRIWLPMVNQYADLGLLYIPAAVFVITATVNGVNFTDGVDGLCSGVTFIVALAFILLCRAWTLPLGLRLAATLAGSCLGFLCFNLFPARIFMGDTGSLALGGAVAALALLTDTTLLLPLLGVIYMVEVVSVIVQTRYFKFSGGKRVFRMAPIHHHFELSGWSEIRVDLVFWLVTALAAMLYLWILL
ncbi:MAG: phospho-N-acetylmuramoyl-pentapeptide-transferase [Clostridiales bacterium]|nr:phospho-N-acetylmuramoyl-pentapeptide-transferase [Clostridiales bacterium]